MIKKSKQLSYWAKLNSLWEASGMPQEKFCKEQGVVYKRFVYWRARVLKRAGQPCAQAQLLTVAPPQQAGLSNLASLADEPPSTFEVELPTGVRFYIKSTSDIDKACALLQQLGGGLC